MIPKEKPPKRSVKDDLSIVWDMLKSITFFLGLYLFFIGWLYLYFYFDKFGISFSSISLDISSYYNYGFFALVDSTMFLIFLVFAAGFFLVYYKRKNIRYAYIFILAMLISFFITSYYVTRDNARSKAVSILKKEYKLDPIYFDLTEDFLKSMSKDSIELKLLNFSDTTLSRANAVNKSVKLLYYNNHNQLYLIYENKDSYFVIYNPNKRSTLKFDIEVYDISKEHTNYAKKIKSYNNE